MMGFLIAWGTGNLDKYNKTEKKKSMTIERKAILIVLACVLFVFAIRFVMGVLQW